MRNSRPAVGSLGPSPAELEVGQRGLATLRRRGGKWEESREGGIPNFSQELRMC